MDSKQGDFSKIEQEVMNRARQMQQKIPPCSEVPAQSKTSRSNKKSNAKQQDSPPKPAQEIHNEAPSVDELTPRKPPDIMDLIMADKERSLIVLLILLLTEEGADSTLVLALMYLII